MVNITFDEHDILTVTDDEKGWNWPVVIGTTLIENYHYAIEFVKKTGGRFEVTAPVVDFVKNNPSLDWYLRADGYQGIYSYGEPFPSKTWEDHEKEKAAEEVVEEDAPLGHLTPDQANRAYLGAFLYGMQILLKKRIDYSGIDDPFSNFRRSAKITGIHPVIGILQRIGDKISRANNLITNHDNHRMVEDESLLDTFIDMLNYVGLAIGILSEEDEDMLEMLTDRVTNLIPILASAGIEEDTDYKDYVLEKQEEILAIIDEIDQLDRSID